jgi:TolA-binding protein
MEIRKLKKKLLKEERRHRRRNSKAYRLLRRAIPTLLILLLAGGGWELYRREGRDLKYYARAEAQQLAGRYQEAARLYKKLQRRHPDSPKADVALYRLGQIRQLQLKSYPEAILAFLSLEKDYPHSPLAGDALRQVADLYKNQLLDYSRAIVIYQKLLDRGTAEADAVQYQIADCYFRLNNFEQARIEFESLLKNHPESLLSAEVHYRLAVNLALEGEGKKAIAAFEQVEERWPESPYAVEARFGRAGVLEDRDDLGGALRLLEKLRDSYPNGEILEQRISQVKTRIKKKTQGL